MYRFVERLGRGACAYLKLTLLGMVLFSFHGAAQAFVENNVTCSSNVPGLNDLGTVAPGERILISTSTSCRMLRRFPQGAGISYTAQYANGLGDPAFYFFQPGTYMAVPYGGQGTFSSTCALGGSCVDLPVGTQFDLNVQAGGVAKTEPGIYHLQVSLWFTSRANTNYSQSYLGLVYIYTVAAPACTLTSPSAANLYFGTVSSDQLSGASQVADISLSCQSATRAQATLVPTQSAVTGKTGVSATTLSGLSMASTWDDTRTPVAFGTPRSLNLNAGSNSLRLRFQPQLTNPGSAPSGNFASQYTLNITYP
ncbi:hypothetical protein PS623_02350 [Pseudomonas fluorescens]|nr:hypothetical protein PS623_02350 [Pseudomonas fluorescens]